MVGALILQLVLISLNAIFASAEIAVISVSSTKLQKLSEEGSAPAARLLALTADSSKFLSTIQVAITLAGLLGSAYAADNFAEPLVGVLVKIGISLDPDLLRSICVFAITLLLSYFSIVFGELVPKRVALKNSEKAALGLAGLLSFVSRIFAPFVWILTKSTNGVLRLLGIDPNEDDEAATEEDILMMVDSGSKMGNIDSLESEMIQNVFEFDDVSAEEICTHRREVAFLYEEESLEEWKTTIGETRFNFYPICREDPDHVVAVLDTKKLFRSAAADKEQAYAAAVKKPYFVPGSMKADVLFTNMKQMRSYFAVVLDEYGGTSGVVTMHNILELLVGDMKEEEDDTGEEIQPLGEGRYRIMGATLLEDLDEALGLQLQSDEYDTFGGYIMSFLRSVPEDGSVVELETPDLFIRADHINRRRIESAVVRKKTQQE